MNEANQETEPGAAEAGQSLLKFELLGGFRVLMDGSEARGFVSAKARAMLVFLAVTGRPHHRETLAGMFWGDQPEADARTSLRQAIASLKRVVGDHLVVSRTTVELQRGPQVDVDVTRFEKLAVSTLHDDGKSGVGELSAAAALYHGDFLSGFIVRDSPDWDEWVIAQRERLRRTAAEVNATLATVALRRADTTAALAAFERLVTIEPWREDAHRSLMRLHVTLGNRAAALAQYRDCVRVLEDEFDAEPEPETVELFGRIRDGHAIEPGVDPVGNQLQSDDSLDLRLTEPRTRFVGRKSELAQIVHNLEDPDCRLLTIVGAGGIGKTRLALQSLPLIRNAFPDGVYVVPVAGLHDTGLLVPVIAQLLGVDVRGGNASVEDLAMAIHGRRFLLLLDNLEHLRHAAEVVSQLLEGLPESKVLATSRERLGLSAEWLVPLDGLSIVGDGRLVDSGQGNTAGDAVALFLQRTRQVLPSFAPSPEARFSVSRICQLLAGSPLGIELAASWVRVMSPDEIVTQLDRGLDLLVTDARDVPERHRSMRLVFDASWRLLSEQEQSLLQRLSVFRGGFRAEAAELVTGVSRRERSSFIDRSLLQRGENGRFVLHELLRQYLFDRLQLAQDAKETLQAHASHYLRLLRAHGTELRALEQEHALRVLDTEIENIRAAWEYALAEVPATGDVLAASVGSLVHYYDLRGWLAEADRVLTRTEGVLGRCLIEPAGGSALVLARIRASHGYVCYELGQHERASELLHASIEFLNDEDVAHARQILGMILTAWGEYGAAEEQLREALERYSAAGDRLGEADALNLLGGIAQNRADYSDSTRLWSAAIAVRQTIGDWMGVAQTLNSLAENDRIAGDYEAARHRSLDSLAVLRDHGLEHASDLPYDNLGLIARVQGDYEASRHYHQLSLEFAERRGSRRSMSTSLMRLAWTDFRAGRLDEARHKLDDGIVSARRIGFRRGVAHGLSLRAIVAGAAGNWREALEIANEAVTEADAIGARRELCAALNGLAQAALMVGEREVACRSFKRALVTAQASSLTPETLFILAAIGRQVVLNGGSDREAMCRAGTLLTYCEAQPALWHEVRENIEAALSSLTQYLDDTGIQVARQSASSVTIDDAVALGERLAGRLRLPSI